jgi:hypothetical protein
VEAPLTALPHARSAPSVPWMCRAVSQCRSATEYITTGALPHPSFFPGLLLLYLCLHLLSCSSSIISPLRIIFDSSISLSIYLYVSTYASCLPSCINSPSLSHINTHSHSLPAYVYAYAYAYAYITEGLCIETVLVPALLHPSPRNQSTYMGLTHASRGSSVPQQVRE